MGSGCRCGGFTERDISPWCEIHATKTNLTEEERKEAIEKKSSFYKGAFDVERTDKSQSEWTE